MRLATVRPMCGAISLLVTIGCNSTVPSEPATAKAVVDQLAPGRTIRLDVLFGIVMGAAGSRHLLSREYFQMVAFCEKSDVIVHVSSLSGSKWDTFLVAVHHPRQVVSTHEASVVNARWRREKVRTT